MADVIVLTSRASNSQLNSSSRGSVGSLSGIGVNIVLLAALEFNIKASVQIPCFVVLHCAIRLLSQKIWNSSGLGLVEVPIYLGTPVT